VWVVSYRAVVGDFQAKLDGAAPEDLRRARAEAIRQNNAKAARHLARAEALARSKQEAAARERESLRREIEAQIRSELETQTKQQRQEAKQALEEVRRAAAAAAAAEAAIKRRDELDQAERRRSRRSSRHPDSSSSSRRSRSGKHRRSHRSRRDPETILENTDSDSSSAASGDEWGGDMLALEGVPVAGAAPGDNQQELTSHKVFDKTKEVALQLKLRTLQARVDEAQAQVWLVVGHGVGVSWWFTCPSDRFVSCTINQAEYLTHMFTSTVDDVAAASSLKAMLIKQQQVVARYQAKTAFARVEVCRSRPRLVSVKLITLFLQLQRLQSIHGTTPSDGESVTEGADAPSVDVPPSIDSEPADNVAPPRTRAAWAKPTAPDRSVGAPAPASDPPTRQAMTAASAGAKAASAAASAAASTARRIAAEVNKRARGGAGGLGVGSVVSSATQAAASVQPRFRAASFSQAASPYAPRQMPGATSLSAAQRGVDSTRSPGFGPPQASCVAVCLPQIGLLLIVWLVGFWWCFF